MLKFISRIIGLAKTQDIKRSPRPFLDNIGLVKKLKDEYGIDMKSVFRLHKVMERMGVIEKTSNGWLLTEEGRQRFTGWRSRVYDPDWWNPSIVDEIANYVKENDIDPDNINRKW